MPIIEYNLINKSKLNFFIVLKIIMLSEFDIAKPNPDYN